MSTPPAPTRRGSRFRAAAPPESEPTVSPTPAPANVPTPGSPMAANCPHCTKPIESLSGFISQADHQARLNEKTAKVTALEAQIADLTPKAQGYETVNAALARAQADAANAREDLSLAGRGITDAKKISSLRAIHAAEVAAVEEGKRPTLAAWLDSEDGKTHPVVAMVMAPAAAPVVPAASPAPGTPAPVVAPAPMAPGVTPGTGVNNLPAVSTGAAPTPVAAKTRLTPKQLADYLASSAYLNLPKEQRKAKKAELDAEYSGETPHAPASA